MITQNERISISRKREREITVYVIVQWLHRKISTANIRVTNAWKDVMSVMDLRAVWPNSCGLKGELLERIRNISVP